MPIYYHIIFFCQIFLKINLLPLNSKVGVGSSHKCDQFLLFLQSTKIGRSPRTIVALAIPARGELLRAICTNSIPYLQATYGSLSIEIYCINILYIFYWKSNLNYFLTWALTATIEAFSKSVIATEHNLLHNFFLFLFSFCIQL